jgi:hypothetical protein
MECSLDGSLLQEAVLPAQWFCHIVVLFLGERSLFKRTKNLVEPHHLVDKVSASGNVERLQDSGFGRGFRWLWATTKRKERFG